MDSAIRFDDVSIALGGRQVLERVSFTIPRGTVVGVLGPNGAGKTTLLRACLGLVSPERGRIAVLGTSPRAARRQTGYLPQLHRPLPAMRLGVAEILALGLPGFALIAAGRARAAVREALARVDAEALADRPFSALSGGERQRVLLAQALLGRPSLLLLDEPLAGLDPRRQAELVSLVGRLRRELGLTAILSAHELNPLLPTIDLVLYLGGGQAALGTPAEVVTGPVLSRLYDAPISVLRSGGHVFVHSDGVEIERGAHGCAGDRHV